MAVYLPVEQSRLESGEAGLNEKIGDLQSAGRVLVLASEWVEQLAGLKAEVLLQKVAQEAVALRKAGWFDTRRKIPHGS